MKNYRTSDFDQVPHKEQRKSFFDLSHQVKTQMCFGRYYPIHWEETYPGDYFRLDSECKFEFPATYVPLQQLGTMRADWFWVSYSVLFRGDFADNYNKTGWRGFIMGEDIVLPKTELNINGNPGDGVTNLYPGCSYPIENYMGFPMDITDRIDSSKQWGIAGNAFPLAMYLIVYDEYYMNPLWEEPQFFNLSENPSTNASNFNAVRQNVDGIQYVSWDKSGTTAKIVNHPPFFAHYMKDYFTASRPEPQDGEAVKIPSLTDQGPPYGTQIIRDSDSGAPVDAATLGSDGAGVFWREGVNDPVILDTTNTDPDIRQFRLANIMQQFKEMVARFGKARYRDWIKGTHGTNPEPGILDIPQLVGSVFGRLIVSNTMTTADTSESKTGNYRGNVNFYDNGSMHDYYCPDYGMLMYIVNVMPDTSYSQGIHPKWTREVAQDYPLDIFSGIGDQGIKRKELLALNVSSIWANPDLYDGIIGYNDRFAEVKTAVNRTFTTKELYNSWYMGQILSTDELDYEEITAGRLIVGASYSTSNGIREADVFNELPIKSGNSTYTDATIFAHFVLTIKVERCLPFFSTPGKQIF